MKSSSSSLRITKVLSRVFPEDYEVMKRKMLDPRGEGIHRWNKVFMVACLVSLFVDPLFFYLPSVNQQISCIKIEITLEIILTVLRTLCDCFYIAQIYVKFRTAYVAPSSRVFGRGELVVHPRSIAIRYLKREFFINLFAALPLPQVLIWGVIPNLNGSVMTNTKNLVRFILIFQYIPRLILVYPLSSQIVNATGIVAGTAWAGAAYNLMLFMLASHVIGACWYLLAIDREEGCWRNVCNIERPRCQQNFFDCKGIYGAEREDWYNSSNITKMCDPIQSDFPYGMYHKSVTIGISSSPFLNKYFYCLWWGLKNLSSFGQDLMTSTSIGEIWFAITVATLGLVLFALLIGNMETYLQSTTVRLEEMRVRRTDAEEWMEHRQLPSELRQSVRRYEQYKWVTTRGVNEEDILKGLPMDLRRDIKRHLCLDLVRRVPVFNEMDERMLDAICERLKPSLCTEASFLVREGDPVSELVFIIRGHLDSHTTNGGRTGFYNSCKIGPGDFCGEELLTWALDPQPSVIFPSSTRTVKAISEVEAFALRAEDLKFVVSQFGRLHSKQLRHKFRFYSANWRTWAACFIQTAWHRYQRRKNTALVGFEFRNQDYDSQVSSQYGYKNSGNKLEGSNKKGGVKHSDMGSNNVGTLQKPVEPNFSVDEED